MAVSVALVAVSCWVLPLVRGPESRTDTIANSGKLTIIIDVRPNPSTWTIQLEDFATVDVQEKINAGTEVVFPLPVTSMPSRQIDTEQSDDVSDVEIRRCPSDEIPDCWALVIKNPQETVARRSQKLVFTVKSDGQERCSDTIDGEGERKIEVVFPPTQPFSRSVPHPINSPPATVACYQQIIIKVIGGSFASCYPLRERKKFSTEYAISWADLATHGIRNNRQVITLWNVRGDGPWTSILIVLTLLVALIVLFTQKSIEHFTAKYPVAGYAVGAVLILGPAIIGGMRLNEIQPSWRDLSVNLCASLVVLGVGVIYKTKNAAFMRRQT